MNKLLRFSLMNCEAALLDEIGHDEMKRNDIALTYAMALTSDEDIDFPKVNAAIIDRWSTSALAYIKTRAWKLVCPPQDKNSNG